MESDDRTRTSAEVVLREERLVADKRREVDRVVRVDRAVATSVVSKTVALAYETLHLERRAPDPHVDYDVAPIVEPQRLVVQVSRESAVVGKRLVVDEVVDLHRIRTQDVRHISGVVRRERLTVDEREDG